MKENLSCRTRSSDSKDQVITLMQKDMYVYAFVCICIRNQVHSHTYAYLLVQVHIETQMHSCVPTHVDRQTHSHLHMQTYTCASSTLCNDWHNKMNLNGVAVQELNVLTHHFRCPGENSLMSVPVV